ncbi:HOT protein, partial [Polyodon spathula]|nr:HOT protein [Polyodon spathula]
MTDKNLARLPPVKAVFNSLAKHGVNFKFYDKVRVEPTDASFKEAIDFAKRGQFDAYVAVGGGSVIDTCKAANLYACNPKADFLDYVNAPIGKGKPVTGVLKPFIAVPTTAGTGSETTGVAIFDFESLKAKTGIASRAIKPTLGMVDPLHSLHMPQRVAANSGFDVLCHALESYTALPYNMRSPCPSNPIYRPAYQGSNPISDVWSKHALNIVARYMKRAVRNADDLEARSSMHLASVFAGIGFGNAGVHLCHGMSYPIAGLVKTYRAQDYNVNHPLVPHGLSVVLTAPAVFTFTGSMCPERHLEAAEILGKQASVSFAGTNVRNAKREDAGLILADTLRKFLFDLNVDDGLSAIGYTKEDIPDLVKGTIPQLAFTKHALCASRAIRKCIQYIPWGEFEPWQSERLSVSDAHGFRTVKRKPSIFDKSEPSPIIISSLKRSFIHKPNTDVTEGHCLKTQKNVKGDLVLALGPEATLPLTGSVSQNSPSILRKILMKNKWSGEYVGATNSAFESD